MEQYKLQQVDKDDVLVEIMNLYGNDLTRLAYSYVKEQTLAEDITQEVFVKCYMKLDTFKGNSSVKTWLNRITINKCKDHLKSGWRKYIQFELPIFKTPKTKTTPESELNKKIDHDALTEAILDLPVKYREIIILHYFQELSTNEIGLLLNMKDTSIRTRLRRARQLLEDELNKRNDQK
ncbi:sigma-70 family RNA polymerase sigma factor [Alkalihalobacillus sp. TS-13]|uniref:sigma-70 family RNA polymerase sigma factor n=1 Tax=Alkalihalobacillus sp. TS-13 TaxID=2842455 RepID=UPI001C879CF0|nr:sigma-70 family RNA polymerase sigma factor [Alkalihalobacillus sp. TS-13]